MNEFYASIGVTKQAVNKMLRREYRSLEELSYITEIVREVRQDHPSMGVRDIYYMVQPEGVGRDRFEAYCRSHGLMSKRKVWRCHTTDSSGVTRFEDLVSGRTADDVNQIWQSDITYFDLDGTFAYMTFITDRCSRRIVGYSVSRRLFTEDTTLPALRMALATRRGDDLSGLVFHSDGGGQYYSKAFIKETAELGIRNSMCVTPWDNGLAERINGVIKNNYLVHWNIHSFDKLLISVDRAVELYNYKKPHIKLKRLTPVEYEKKLSLQHAHPISQGALDVTVAKM